jgi:sugar phosphate isomerase/epimerase
LKKFALSSSAYSRYKLAQAIRRVALAGYSGIEVVADVPHAYPPLLNEADRNGIRHALAENRLAVSNVNAAPTTALHNGLRPSWIESDPILRGERIQHTLDVGALAKDIGGPTVSTVAGGRLERTPREAAVRWFAAGLRKVAAEVKKEQCPPVLVVPEPGLLVQTADEAAALIHKVGAPGIGIGLNTAHLLRSGEDPSAVVRRLGEAIRHVHVEDTEGDVGSVVVPGAGKVDFAAIFAALDDAGYDGWYTVELAGADVHPDEAAREALQFLQQFDQ